MWRRGASRQHQQHPIACTCVFGAMVSQNSFNPQLCNVTHNCNTSTNVSERRQLQNANNNLYELRFSINYYTNGRGREAAEGPGAVGPWGRVGAVGWGRGPMGHMGPHAPHNPHIHFYPLLYILI